jgi:hypothetical protein
MPFVGVGVAKSLNLLTFVHKMLALFPPFATLGSWVQALPLGDLLTVVHKFRSFNHECKLSRSNHIS